jgi:hypothetical protein
MPMSRRNPRPKSGTSRMTAKTRPRSRARVQPRAYDYDALVRLSASHLDRE